MYNAPDESDVFSPNLHTHFSKGACGSAASPLFDNAANDWGLNEKFWDCSQLDLTWSDSELPTPMDDEEMQDVNTFHQDMLITHDFEIGK